MQARLERWESSTAVAGRPGVLMVTGAYYPELSGGGLQCRALIDRLRDRVDFTVITTTTDRSLSVNEVQDGVPVHRVHVDATRWSSKVLAAMHLTAAFFRARRRFSIVHLHGFSQKSILLVWLALALRKKVAIKMTSLGDDDPVSLQRRGPLTSWSYRRADLFFAVSPGFLAPSQSAGLAEGRLQVIPNGVRLDRFRPPAEGEREAIRRRLSIPAGSLVALFVGFFSRDKRPDLLFEAWEMFARSSGEAVLVLVGASRSPYHEIDEGLAERIRSRAADLGLSGRVQFVEATTEIEMFHRAADMFVMPSVREGLPNALLEAMASGCACIATRIAGVTDRIIDEGRNGLLIPPDDAQALERSLRRLAEDPALRARLGSEARRTVETQYSLDRTAAQYLAAYRRLLSG